MDKIKKFLVCLGAVLLPESVLRAFNSLFATQSLGSAGLTFTTTTWQTASIVPYLINGLLYLKAIVTTLAVPAGIAWTGVASTYNAGGFVIALDSAGNVTTYPTAVTATTLSSAVAISNLVWPTVPEGLAVIGVIVIASTTANTTFTPATTALNAAGITTTFINITGPFAPASAF